MRYRGILRIVDTLTHRKCPEMRYRGVLCIVDTLTHKRCPEMRYRGIQGRSRKDFRPIRCWISQVHREPQSRLRHLSHREPIRNRDRVSRCEAIGTFSMRREQTAGSIHGNAARYASSRFFSASYSSWSGATISAQRSSARIALISAATIPPSLYAISTEPCLSNRSRT